MTGQLPNTKYKIGEIGQTSGGLFGRIWKITFSIQSALPDPIISVYYSLTGSDSLWIEDSVIRSYVNKEEAH